MKKILTALALAITTLILVTPLGIGANSNDFNYTVNPIVVSVDPGATQPNGLPLCGTGSGTIVCYSPKFIRTAYDVPSSLDGSGQTIVIVDAFGSPTITSDLAFFDAVFGLPAPPSFTIFCGNSNTPFDPSSCPAVPLGVNTRHDVAGWAGETSLDVEWAHAIAPGANIVLDVAATSSGNAINDAEAAAIAAFPGAVFSQSFGIPEIFVHNNNAQINQAQANYATGVGAGDTFFASAGDTGADFGTGVAMANFPGSDLHNTAVTGTQGNPYNATGTLQNCASASFGACTSGLVKYHGFCHPPRRSGPNCIPDTYGGEQVWNEPIFGVATGGAQSLLFGVPSYQTGLGLSSRGPDVAYDAAVDGGVLGTFGGRCCFVFGGTSAGSPQWAGITALANQARAMAGKGTIGDLNPTLYKIYHGTAPYSASSYGNDFHDIIVGNDQLVGSPVGYSAGAGYDLASGIGSPDVANLIADLVLA